MIICQCRDLHRPHEFLPGQRGMCDVCGHVIHAHKSAGQDRNIDVAERVTRMLRLYEIDNWVVRVVDNGVHVELDLVLPTRGSGS